MNTEITTAQATAEFIATVDKKLAAIFLAQTFNRVLIARAFAGGLVNDTLEMGATIIAMAELDQQERALAA